MYFRFYHMNDVTFAHKPRLVDVDARRRRPAEAQCTCSLGLGYKLCAVILVAGRRTHGTTFPALNVTSQVTTPGAESAVYNCLVSEASAGWRGGNGRGTSFHRERGDTDLFRLR